MNPQDLLDVHELGQSADTVEAQRQVAALRVSIHRQDDKDCSLQKEREEDERFTKI